MTEPRLSPDLKQCFSLEMSLSDLIKYILSYLKVLRVGRDADMDEGSEKRDQ